MAGRFDALIVGGGPAGSTAAILLARAGWSVALVEKQGFPRRKVCGECIAASNLPLLEALGIGKSLECAAGPELRKVALMRADTEIVADLPAAEPARLGWGRALGRETLDTLLLEQARASGAQVFQPWTVRAIHRTGGDWHCEIRAPDSSASSKLHCALAIDAHGSWETLAANRDHRSPARCASDLFAFKANFLGATIRSGLLPVLALPGGYGGMVVASGGVSTVACCIRRDRLDALRAASPGSRAGDVVEAWLRRECRGVRLALDSAWRDGPWLAAGPIRPGIRIATDDGLMRIGNAAGEAHPILGEGMSMALQSAALLCAQLLDRRRCAGAPGETWQYNVRAQYVREWRRQFETRIFLASAFAQMAMQPACALPLTALLRFWPGLLTAGARWGGKVRCAADVAGLPGVRESAPAWAASAVEGEEDRTDA